MALNGGQFSGGRECVCSDKMAKYIIYQSRTFTGCQLAAWYAGVKSHQDVLLRCHSCLKGDENTKN